MILFAASSTSGAVNRESKLKRMAESRWLSGTFIACNTGEGSSDPLEQAEPVEQATILCRPLRRLDCFF